MFLASQPISARLRRSPAPQDPHADGGRAEVLRSRHEQAPFRQTDRFVVCSCLYELNTKRSYKAKKLKCLVFFVFLIFKAKLKICLCIKFVTSIRVVNNFLNEIDRPSFV